MTFPFLQGVTLGPLKPAPPTSVVISPALAVCMCVCVFARDRLFEGDVGGSEEPRQSQEDEVSVPGWYPGRYSHRRRVRLP